MNLTNEALDALERRLRESSDRIGLMCTRGHGPRMSIPARDTDDDIFIVNANRDAADTIAALRAELAKVREDARRYRTARCMNPAEWLTIWERNVRERIPFDKLVDAHEAAIAARTDANTTGAG